MAENSLKELLGIVGYAVVKPLLRGVKIHFNHDAGTVTVVKDGKVKKIVPFATIEATINEQA